MHGRLIIAALALTLACSSRVHGEKGGSAEAGQSFVNNETMRMYQLTPTGLTAEATVAAKKFWKSDLNKK